MSYPFDDVAMSRREMLRQGAAAVVGGAAAIGGDTAFAQAPAVFTGWKPATAGRKFRALVRYRSSLDVQELTLNPIEPRQIVARVQAAQACYTMVGALNTTQPVMNPAVFGHGAVAIVEEVGPLVKRVQPGDRVLVVVTGQCGQCFQCLRGSGVAADRRGATNDRRRALSQHVAPRHRHIVKWVRHECPPSEKRVKGRRIAAAAGTGGPRDRR